MYVVVRMRSLFDGHYKKMMKSIMVTKDGESNSSVPESNQTKCFQLYRLQKSLLRVIAKFAIIAALDIDILMISLTIYCF